MAEQPDESQQWLDVLKSYEPIAMRIAIALGVIATLATNVYNGCESTKQQAAIHQDVNSAKDVQAKAVAVAVRGNPEDVAALKQTVEATTQQTK